MGEAARRDGHRLRAIHDAILVGVETVIQADGSMSVFTAGGQPLVLEMRATTGGRFNQFDAAADIDAQILGQFPFIGDEAGHDR